MSKAYLFAVILLAASLTGCIESGDELEKSTSPNEEEDILQPVGTDGNETVSHDELIAEIANLTEQVKELNEQIAVLSDDLQSLEYYQYNPPENSTIYMYDYQSWEGESIVNYIVTKTGNSVHINYTGNRYDYGMNTSAGNCTYENQVVFYTSDMSVIMGGNVFDIASNFTRECSFAADNLHGNEIYSYYTTATFELKQEPVRIALYGQTLTF